VASTGITGWELSAGPVRRAGLAAYQARVRVDDDVPGRRAAELLALARAAVPAAAARLASAAITALAEAEGRIHGMPAADVHLHELGGVDTIVDTVGVAAALHALRVSEVWSAPLALGSGVIEMRHGQYPAPAPATVALLEGAQVTGIGSGAASGPGGTGGESGPGRAAAGETVTPTGAALLRAAGCQYGPMPAMRVSGSGYGAGGRDVPGRPNVLPVLLGEPLDHPEPDLAAGAAGGHGAATHGAATHGTSGDSETLIIVETTVDDVTGELLGDLPGLLLGAGALDAWITAVTGKKGRPAHVVTALCRPGHDVPVQARLLAETGSLGARRHPVRRDALPRREAGVTVQGHPIRVKVGPYRAKPEHDDVAAAALATGLPRRVVAEQALSQLDQDPDRETQP
jgi:hypothetical protein